MIYRVTHSTTYEYAGSVSPSHHAIRLRPRDLPYQRCLRHELHIDPAPDVTCNHVDYFGNAFTFATIERAHKTLVITAHSEVEIGARTNGKVTNGTSPGRLDADQLMSRDFLHSSPLIKRSDELAAYALPSFPNARPLREAVLDLTARIHADFKFESGATSVSTPLPEFFKSRRGVCQDFAQLQIGCLRSIGLAARYVSGYLETTAPAGRPRLIGADASHAWVSVYDPESGWLDVDPTNNLVVGDRHVTLGWGRDYSDISPVRGIIVGSGEHSMRVSVDVARVEGNGALEGGILIDNSGNSALPGP